MSSRKACLQAARTLVGDEESDPTAQRKNYQKNARNSLEFCARREEGWDEKFRTDASLQHYWLKDLSSTMRLS